MRKTLYYLFFLIFLFIITINVEASNRIKNIDMYIYLDEYGNANVTEIWDTYLDSGTEGYRSFSKIDNKSIIDFSVYDDKEIFYTYKNYWNTNLSFNDKAYKNGINYTNDGLELCWGISEYGDRKYTLNYKINNFVTKYTDTQGIYFNLLNLDQNVGNVNVTISSYEGAIKNDSLGDASWWWLRSANSSNDSDFYYVRGYGSWYSYNANNTYGVSPAFRLAD